MKRFLWSFLAVILAFSLVLPVPTQAATSVETAAKQSTELKASQSKLALTEVREVTVSADLGQEVDLEQVELQFGGKPLAEWKKWDAKSTSFAGDPFITIKKAPHYVNGTTTIEAKLEFDLPFGTDDLSPRSIRVQYKQLLGDYELALVDKEHGTKAATTVKLNVYDEFLEWDEIKPSIDGIIEKAAGLNGRYVQYESPGKSTEGRDFHMVILAKNEAAVDTYLTETLPVALETPDELIAKLKDGTMGDYQVPVWFNNIHPDETEGIDFQTELLEKFATEKEVTFTKTNEDGTDEEVKLNVDEVLDHLILIFNFSHNPDGRVHNTRANVNGFDLNRDNAYQTQVETIQLNPVIAKWTPLAMMEGHGYVKGFLIEPATPPHNPNFEYDLLMEGMIPQAHAMGQAGIGSSALTSYFLAAEEYKDGWDDMGPSYTPIFSMLHGTLGHTVEVPTLGQESYKAMVGAGLGMINYVFENKDELYSRQLEIFNRGVKGEDNRNIDPLLTNAAGESIGRTRGENENFFPDYYVMPVGDKQKNVAEVYNMVDYLIRNGVKVEQTTEDIKVDGKAYPKGTYVVPMKQAKRGLANAMLYKGDDVSDWEAMYDPVVANFPALRGFDIQEIRVTGEDALAERTEAVSKVEVPASFIDEKKARQVLKNVNNDTIKLVNELLKDGKSVGILKEGKFGFHAGDFIVRTEDLLPYADQYVFEAAPLPSYKAVKAKWIAQPKVASNGSGQLIFSLKELGFELAKEDEAEIVVSDAKLPEELAGKAFVGIGNNVLKAVKEAGVLEGFDYQTTSGGHEGLIKADINFNHSLMAGYDREELLYTTRGSWITAVPKNAAVLATVKDTPDFYVAGWWPGHEGAQGQVLAFTQQLEGGTITLFANDLAFRAHTKHSYRMLANSIFAAASEVPAPAKDWDRN
ncbi:zinc carboxypeptidase [Sporosarcina sp. NCCP-2222]|uniref:M14 family metallopeptidase n=1 Tax=Sporosarcina sp. NCCP-2222 TaxID=2935073 RepID=UPI00208C9FD3|nr:M14 family zinc carboxypeptidase [Sporosarcina sp. NCCP-2222]GKV57664.1 zinc carboxypeptidase [Sporosarcina sp. NCCP-2222]